jgi:glycosyltransferase involved in cell wall biosynthesis
MPVHICLITNRHWLYDGRVTNQARSLAAAGYRVTIADMGRPADWYRAARAGVADPTQFFPPSCAVKRIEDPGHRLPSAMQKFIRRQLRWFLAGSRIRQLAALAADIYQAPDLVTARYAQRAAAKARARFVYDIRDFYSAEWEGGRLSRVRRRGIAQEAYVMRRAHACLTVTPGLADLVARRYRMRPHVIRSCRDPIGRDVTGPDVRGTLGLSASTPLLVHTGHRIREAGLPQQVEIVRALPGVHLALVGQQQGVQDVEQAARQANVQARVHVLPAVAAAEVPAFIRTADAALIYMYAESENARHALPNKFFEAIAARLPVAISDGAGFRPLVQRYGFGVLFNPLDLSSAVAAVTEVLRNNQRYRDAADVAAEHLSWRHESTAYVQVYRELLAVASKTRATG